MGSDKEDKEAGRIETFYLSIRRLIRYLGDNPDREGLWSTPQRVFESFSYFLSGYNETPDKHLRLFDCDHDQMIVFDSIQFVSMCEHHMMPFYGACHVGYIPNGKILGASKFSRILDCFSKRLQTQEQLTTQYAKYLLDKLSPVGLGVLLEAKHTCMACRGIEDRQASMVTAFLAGAIREKHDSRDEFYAILNRKGVNHVS